MHNAKKIVAYLSHLPPPHLPPSLLQLPVVLRQLLPLVDLLSWVLRQRSLPQRGLLERKKHLNCSAMISLFCHVLAPKFVSELPEKSLKAFDV